MAIISCPGCKKNISSHTALCPYCGLQRGEVSEEQLREFKRRKLRDRIYHLKMTSYAALALLLAAAGWFLVETSNFQNVSPKGPYVLFFVGVVFYLVVRIYLHRFKSALKKLGP